VLVVGFQAVQPNDARALLLFGEYRGSIVKSGFFWVNPFYSKKRISLRVRRSLALRHPYDSEDHEVSLRGSTTVVCEQLKQDVQERLDKAGVEVVDARISHLAYSAEIAAASRARRRPPRGDGLQPARRAL
jgi:regulator of protease activity HflC (stomatin/prohibitin superfamily)